jgi:hypothetical protein
VHDIEEDEEVQVGPGEVDLVQHVAEIMPLASSYTKARSSDWRRAGPLARRHSRPRRARPAPDGGAQGGQRQDEETSTMAYIEGTNGHDRRDGTNEAGVIVLRSGYDRTYALGGADWVFGGPSPAATGTTFCSGTTAAT